ncbi:GNAT family N-acetyltransferase [Neorhodopirellula pilleata]|uniref:Amino-acid acetyltransferase n=1 Tax=Neorhodopirellula pilleata TaxID=2714738 RepID=A0A5C5ZFH2_9BACT|nr:GNAT family N-acetyltransferase [Neorhodopirellula pilleata]TWT86072.1 Amino-acid acetyltransferase [Neorhodopirellula pilleata]
MSEPSGETAVPFEFQLRQATPSDAPAIHALMRPFVAQHLLLSRSEAEVIELTRHGFIAMKDEKCMGFAAVEIYSPKLAELQCLAVHPEAQRHGVGRKLVAMCIDRARSLGIMEVLAISSSEDFLRSCGFDFSLPDQKKALFYQIRPRNFDDIGS